MGELATDHLIDGKYRVVRLAGRGAWAVVYEALNVRIQRRVAIKVLNADLAANADLLARFNREAEAATQIESPFVVTVFDAGQLPDGRPYIVMEYLEGEDLGKRLQTGGPLLEEQAASYAVQLLSGLADAHAMGVLHRDIKPDNLIIVRSRTGEEIVKIVDFGISKPTVARPESLGLTRTDSILGSPVYMSPEQVRGTRHMDHRSDLYSVAVVVYEALTAALPHEAETFNELMFKVALEDAPDLRTVKPEIDAGMAEIVAKGLSREPDQRFQSATDFREALLVWLEKRGLTRSSVPHYASKMRVRTTDGDRPSAIATRSSTSAGDVGAARKSIAPTAAAATPAAEPSQLAATGKTTSAAGAPHRRLALIAGGAGALLLIGGALAFGLTRSTAPPPAPAAAAAIDPASTAMVAPRTAAASAFAEPHTPAPPTPAPSATTTLSPLTPLPPAPSTPRPLDPSALGLRPTVAPVPTPMPPPSAKVAATAAAPASAPPPAGRPSANAVVEGRAVRTTF